MGTQLFRLCIASLCVLTAAVGDSPSQGVGSVTGKVTYTGTPEKAKLIDMSKDPDCVKLHRERITTEDVVTGPGKTLQNVVVYISVGAPDTSPVPATAVHFDQSGCHYTTHVLAFRAGQDVSISNSDPVSHNIHPMARINREWNRIQPPGTPPFSYSYANAEIIPVKCNIHPWMKAYFFVLNTSHFAVTGEDGSFKLPGLPAGTYTVTAWHEIYGTRSQEITVTGGETQTLNFVFRATP